MSQQSRIRRQSLAVTQLTTAEIVSAASLTDLADELAAPASYLLASPGKQMRSSLLLHAANAGPRPADPLIRTSATAIELFHLATLAHDDLVDDGRLRRGGETVGAAYGSFASGFLGGALFARAAELIAGCGQEPTLRFADAASEVCEGQMLEFEDLYDLGRSARRYRLAIAGKTAALFELAAWLGAWLAGGSKLTTQALARFGNELGMAFQVVDDILDLIGAEHDTGKPQAQDLRQGVYSLPVIHAIAADQSLCSVLEDPASTDVFDVIARIERSGGIDAAIGDCMCHVTRAQQALRRDRRLAASTSERLTTLLRQAIAPIAHRVTPKEAQVA